MKVVTWALLAVLVVLLLAAAGQHYRYLRARRDVVADRQDLLHPTSAFHVATLLALSPGLELLPGVREFVAATEREGAEVVYAGRIAANALRSSQVPQEDWDAFVLAQFPSREAYGTAETNPAYQKARASFAQSYALGMQRSRWLNLAIPVALLGLRIADVVQLRPARYPFRPAADPGQVPDEMREQRARVAERLLANREYGRDAVVVLNFTKSGSEEQREANADYGLEMMKLMAEVGNGPMHIGSAVTLEGDADFDSVVVVYYPGVEFFAEMIQSEFFTGIAGDKQLADTLSSPSVPLLPHL